MADLSRRSSAPELMDGPGVSPEVYRRCLADLASVNRWTLTHRATLRWLDGIADRLDAGAAPLSILDVGCGQGDLLRAIHRWAARRGVAVRLEGLDLNPASAEAAREVTPAAMGIAFRTGDVFTWQPATPPDLIVTSQFAHHLSDDEVVALLGWLERQALLGWFIADLQRHWFAYYGFRWLARVAGWHRIVRLDGTVSIARSFRRDEWQMLLARAGIVATVRWHVPFRLCVSRLR